MTLPIPLTALADCVQALTSACREMDEDIALAVGYRAWGGAHLKGYGLNYCEPSGKYIGAPPKFTESLDAAMTLVPEEYTFNIYGQKNGFIARVFPADIMAAKWKHISEETKIVSTPALALTAASLLARAALENSNG